jgi:hypothetical protein
MHRYIQTVGAECKVHKIISYFFILLSQLLACLPKSLPSTFVLLILPMVTVFTICIVSKYSTFIPCLLPMDTVYCTQNIYTVVYLVHTLVLFPLPVGRVQCIQNRKFKSTSLFSLLYRPPKMSVYITSYLQKISFLKLAVKIFSKLFKTSYFSWTHG